MFRPRPVAISALHHFVRCPRQCALVIVDGVWVENARTARGQRFHKRANTTTNTSTGTLDSSRSVRVWSDVYRLSGRCDVVEFGPHGIVPVEYKSGRRHGKTADVQLCAQALCLEEMFGQQIAHGFLWLGATRRRVRVELDDELRSLTIEIINKVHALFEAEHLPPALNDSRCEPCQFIGVCMPSITATGTDTTKRYESEVLFASELV